MSTPMINSLFSHIKTSLLLGLTGVLIVSSLLITGCNLQAQIVSTITKEPESPQVLPDVIIFTRTPSPTPSPTITETPMPTATDVVSPTPFYPEEYYITGVRGRKQHFSLGCEASAAVDWAGHYGIQINEFEFQHKLPLSDNPDLGFVGSVNSPWGQIPPYGYGVHAEPIAALLQDYGLPAKGVKNFSLEELKKQIAMGNPVIAWVIGNCVGGVPYEYTDQEGNTTTVAAYEHVIIVTGYNKETIRYLNNGRIYETPTDVFTNSWSVLNNMVVIQED